MAEKTASASRGRKPPATLHKAGIWICPRCAKQIEIMVKLTANPVCADHKGGHPTEMQPKGK